ncbi:MAG: hypothetical protein M3070_01725 [Actinomycetota bacterium]|nr:hypothetical protein [Actinomycetota bacterium]
MDASGSAQQAARADAARELEAVRRRRAELLGSLNVVEESLAAAAIGRAVVWGERVHDSLSQLAREFREHIEVTEGPDGLHQSILAGDLRLANAVWALTTEHGEITAEIAAALSATAAPVIPTDVQNVREQATRLLGRISRHRQKGADLVYEAFATDIGGYG